MRILKIFLLVFILSITVFAQWYEKPIGLPDICYAYAIDAVDSSIATGVFSTNQNHIPDSIYLTTNGGYLWFARALPNDLVAYEYLYDVSIENENKIWFCTGEGKIYHTYDGGSTWQLQFYNTSMTNFMNYIEMFDSVNGVAMGDAPAGDQPALFLKTSNGGMNWISQNQSYFLGESNTNIWRTVDFVNPYTGYFVPYGGEIYKTFNGGGFWASISFFNVLVLKAYNANIILGVDQYIIYLTTDGGNNWQLSQSSLLDFGFDIEFIPGIPSKVWYTSSRVSYSSDYGTTWVEEFNLDNYNFMDIIFVDENSGWLMARSTTFPNSVRIFRTTNGGFGGIVSIEENQSEVIELEYYLDQNYPNPFNPTTTIKFTISDFGLTTLKVYDILGREIATLVNEEKPAGEYEFEFNSLSVEGRNLTSGVYLYQLKAGNFVETKKMILLK